MSDEIILSVDNLMMQFGGIKALSDVSLRSSATRSSP